jgi:lipopolysaccharide export LptBFGC system permease protein LptF
VISIGYLGFIDTVERPLRIQAKTFWSERIKKLSDQALTFKQIKKGEIWYATRHIICHIMYYDPNSKSFHGVSISLVDDDFKIRRKINTAVMTWGGNQWIAENATIIDFEKEGASLKKVASLPIEIQETPADLSIFQTPMEDLSIRDIIHVISLMHREGVNFQSYLMELMLRLANALAIVVSVALAIAILARYSRCSLRSEVKSGVYAIIGFGLFFGLFQLGVGLAASSSVPMFLGVWGGHIAAVAIALLLLSK